MERRGLCRRFIGAGSVVLVAVVLVLSPPIRQADAAFLRSGSSPTTTVPAASNVSVLAVSSHSTQEASLASGGLNEPMVVANGGWRGVSLKAATALKIPILFGAVVALFVLIQARADRRDPKMSRAPERGEDETVGFG